MKIVALDFETANSSSASACSLGLSIYEDGVFADSFEWLIKPHSRYNYFTNTYIHLITKEDVEDKEEFLFYYDRLKEITEGAVLVAHNARFDMDVLNSVCDVYGLEHLHNRFLDTVTISRRVYPELRSHRLDAIADYLDIDLCHHNACSDSMACLMILLKAMESYHCYELDEFLQKINVRYRENS
ncbi:MAG: 3'-5' exoribonuclease [Erysipelotrichaceae bacterium]|nr:3'-5' exoribonuclease [Erysipelotrichaceae bacterium]